MEKLYFDLTTNLYLDIYLSIKINTKFVHYIIPKQRKDGTFRQYGDLYKYFTQKEGFRMALGYNLSETLCGKFWKGQTQHLYFDKKTAPYLVEDKILKNPLLLAKKKTSSIKA